MKPTDLRNATWRECLTHVTDDMVRVRDAWLRHGPCTTRELAERSGISLLTLRPRTTDLGKLGLVKLTDHNGNEGIYSFVSDGDAEAAGVWKREADFSTARGEAAAPFANVETVEKSMAQLTPDQQVAIAAAVMSRYGHHKKRAPSTLQEELALA